jgi:hypothetical protein
MTELTSMNGRISRLRTKQRRYAGQGANELANLRARQKKHAQMMKKPRDRHLDKNRLASALIEMSKDLSRLEALLAEMEKRDTEIEEAMCDRRDLLLRDLFKLRRVVSSREMFDDVNRVRSLAEPIGGYASITELPSWAPRPS